MKQDSPPSDSQEDSVGSIEDALGVAIEKPDLFDVLPEVAELALDHSLPDGLLKEIPFFGFLVNGAKLFAGVRDYLFARKVARFLRPISQIPREEREAFTKRLRDQKEFERFSETILLLLDKMDHVSKASIVGAVMEAHIRGKITYTTALRLSSMIEKCFFGDLQGLENFSHRRARKSGENGRELERVGLVALYSAGGRNFGSVRDDDGEYILTEMGDTLLRIRALRVA